MVGVTGFGPAISASQTRRDGLTSLHPQSGWQESDPHVPNAALCQGATTRPVEVVGIGPTAATLARRARYLSCHPQVPAGWQPAGLALGTHAVELTITGHVHPAGWCSQGRKDLNPHQRGWSPLRCRYATPLYNWKPPLPGLPGGGSWLRNFAAIQKPPGRRAHCPGQPCAARTGTPQRAVRT